MNIADIIIDALQILRKHCENIELQLRDFMGFQEIASTLHKSVKALKISAISCI